MLFAFLFLSFGDHRDLHSFPTRRSSDLVLLLFIAVVLGPSVRNTVIALTVVITPSFNRIARGAGGLDVALLTDADRKSTRLNSSHRCISYAVFCLKKKKTTSAPYRLKPS